MRRRKRRGGRRTGRTGKIEKTEGRNISRSTRIKDTFMGMESQRRRRKPGERNKREGRDG